MPNYISNEDMLNELKKYHLSGKNISERVISEQLHLMFLKLATHIARKGCWYNRICKMSIKHADIKETFNELIQDGYYKCVYRIESFDIETRFNPFAYFTSVVYNCFSDFFSLSKRQDILKNIAIVEHNHKFLMRYGFKPIHKGINEE